MKKVRGSFTVEAAVIIPLIMWVFGILLHILFYYHDKNVLTAAAYETAALGCSRAGMEELELEYYFFSRFEEKLLLFTRVECLVQIEEEQVSVKCDGSKRNS